jgi:hypothetical protein
LDEGNARRALLEAENLCLRADLEAEKPRSRKKVKEPPNGTFPSMEAIAQANEASMQPPRPQKRRKTANPPPEVTERVEEVIQVLHKLHEADEMQE